MKRLSTLLFLVLAIVLITSCEEKTESPSVRLVFMHENAVFDTAVADKGSLYRYSIPTLSGYVFSGWKGDDGKIWDDSFVGTSDLDDEYILTPIWQKDSISVEFYVDGKLYHREEDAEYGIENAFPSDPENLEEGIEFISWTLDGSSSIFDSGSYNLPFSENTYIFNAKLKDNRMISVTFRYEGIEDVVVPDARANTPFEMPDYAEKENMTLTGWKIAGTERTFLFSSSSEIELEYDKDGYLFEPVFEPYFVINESGEISANGYLRDVKNLVIPENFDGTKVLSIRSGGFINCTSIESVVFPEGLEIIGNGAFEGCTSLKEATIPASVRRIGEYAFQGTGLESVVFEENPSIEIEKYAFSSLDNLRTLTFGLNSELTVRDYAFYKATSLTELVLPEKTLEIGDGAFRGAPLKAIVIPDSVKKIGSFAFAALIDGDTSLESIAISDKLEEMGANPIISRTGVELIIKEGSESARSYLSELKSSVSKVTLPSTLKTIENEAFKNYESLEMINLPDSVETIGDSAFYGTAISELAIPESTTLIGIGAFENSLLENVTISEDCSIREISDRAFRKTKIRSIVIPDSVTTIGSRAFEECTELESVTLSDNLQSIMDSAFAGNQNLKSIKFPDSVTHLGNGAFSRCTQLRQIELGRGISNLSAGVFDSDSISLTFSPQTENLPSGLLYLSSSIVSVEIPEGTQYIPGNAFYNSKLSEIYIPDSVSEIGESAFGFCSSLRSVSISGNLETICEGAFSGTYDIALEIRDGSKAISDLSVFGEALASVSLPDSITAIEDGAFKNSGIKEITIPESCEIIGDSAFEGSDLKAVTFEGNKLNTIGKRAFYSTGIESITITDSVTVISESAFENCDRLSQIQFTGSGLTEIGSRAFMNTALESIYIPSTTKIIGSYAFYKSSLASVTIPDSVLEIGDFAFSESMLHHIIIPSSVTNLGKSVLYRCESLLSATINAPIDVLGDTSIESPDGFFEGCDLLEMVALPNTLKTIGRETFRDCKSLEKITLPDSLRILQLRAFMDCTSLKSVTLSGELPLDDSNPFEGCSGITLEFSERSETIIGSNSRSDTLGGAVVAVSIPSNARSIGENAFYNWSNLKTVGMENGLETIKDLAFFGTAIENIIIPDTVSTLGYLAFGACGDLTEITIKGDIEIENDVITGRYDVNLIISEGTKEILSSISVFGDYVNRINIPSTVDTIPDNLFASFPNLRAITINKPEGSIAGKPWGAESAMIFWN